MKIFNHTIYASTKIDRHDKTSALSVPSVVDTYQYSYRVNIYSGSESAWTLDKEVTFTYNGWNLIQEVEASVYDSSNSAFTQFCTSNYTWGLDLSQTIQGAGGVSGLLSLDKGTATYYYTYIADKCNDEGAKTSNGNVSELISETGEVVAHYEYSPFGKLTKEILNSQFVINNSFKFSTKYLDNKTQLYYYGYRYYDPVTGRWPSRDPIEERGGYNLYVFLQNNGINGYDYLGWNPHGLPQGSGEPGVITPTHGGNVMPDGTFIPHNPPPPPSNTNNEQVSNTEGGRLQVCSSPAFLDGSPANHAYLRGIGDGVKSCGMAGSSGSGEGGNRGAGAPNNTTDDCVDVVLPVGMSAAEASKCICACMRKKNGNLVPWLPIVNDCHTQLKDCFEDCGITYPGAPRGRVDMPLDNVTVEEIINTPDPGGSGFIIGDLFGGSRSVAAWRAIFGVKNDIR